MNTSATGGVYRRVLSTITDREWLPDVLVFLAYFLTAKLAQYILFTLDTSPALIWAPTGIALAAVLVKGNKMWVPIMLGYVAAISTLPGYLPLENKLIATVGFTVQPLLGAWVLRKFRSDGTIHRSRDVMALMSGAAITAAIGPLFNTFGQFLLGALAETMIITFSRAWAGGLLGIIVMTPLIVGWYHSPSWPIKRTQRAEAVAAFGFLTLAIYMLFWVSIPSLVFLLIFFLCSILFWIAFRFGSRVNTSAILYLSILGILGSIVAHPSSTPLNTQLFADELFLLIIAPIFLQFFVLAEERRQTEVRLNTKVVELERLTHQLAANDEAKNEFIAILAHELRNPLSTLVSTLELLKFEPLHPETSAMVARASQQMFGMRRLLDDLLDVARITERKFEILPEPTDIRTIINRSIHSTEMLRETKRQRLHVHIPEETVHLMADPVRLEQVVINILNNAAKYSKEESDITISCTRENGRLKIEVRDTGDGIPPDRLEEIFSPFQQLVPAPHRAAGIGIGLFLTRQIVEMHGGKISAYSAGIGTGSTFTILLPIRTVTKADKDAIPAPVISQEVSTKRILVVDDNEAAAIGMGKLLGHHGHTVRAVHDGRSAVAATEEFAPHVVLLDIGLPDMSGHDVARSIRASGGNQPILIALTGYGQEEDKNAAMVAGFNHHLTKPVSIAEVIALIERT